MASPPHHRHLDVGPGTKLPEQAGEVSRRSILAGTVATTAVASVSPIAGSAYADAPDPSPRNMMAFLLLSAALTGLHVASLAPEFTVRNGVDLLDQAPSIDPFNVKNDYFKFINAADKTSSFGKLLQVARDHRQSAADIIATVNRSDDDSKFLARSIVLLWYLGSWYEPGDLKGSVGKRAFVDSQVVSAKAYTQGLVWQIAQAHPMGYSNLQFGYWSRDPNDMNDPGDRSKLGLITSTIP
jgi:hypothetical protein